MFGEWASIPQPGAVVEASAAAVGGRAIPTTVSRCSHLPAAIALPRMRSFCFNIAAMSIPVEPSTTSSFLGWQFFFYIGQRSWEGLVIGKAEVRRDGNIECSFQIARRATRADVESRLQEECISWVTEQAAR